jgi:hypothetical protein
MIHSLREGEGSDASRLLCDLDEENVFRAPLAARRLRREFFVKQTNLQRYASYLRQIMV